MTKTAQGVCHEKAAMAAAVLLVAACGGGGGDPVTPGPSDGQRSAAATSTAQSATNDCAATRPFYWEIGDRSAARVSGSVEVAGSSGGPTYTAASSMAIASASKWLYSAYVAEKQAGVLSASDIKFLNFRSGYTSFSSCLAGQTVQQCVDYQSNDVLTPANDGRFYYGGAHMEKHASLIGLGALGNVALAAELRTQLGSDVGFGYFQPQLAGGAFSTAADYARFLRKMMTGSLRMGSLLGSQAVRTNPVFYPADAVYTPIPATEQWHYSLGHWVEDDPLVGDGAFSSAGAFGFYPWIDASRSYYGVIARASLVEGQAGYASVQCGRRIRKAWLTGTAQ